MRRVLWQTPAPVTESVSERVFDVCAGAGRAVRNRWAGIVAGRPACETLTKRSACRARPKPLSVAQPGRSADYCGGDRLAVPNWRAWPRMWAAHLAGTATADRIVHGDPIVDHRTCPVVSGCSSDPRNPGGSGLDRLRSQRLQSSAPLSQIHLIACVHHPAPDGTVAAACRRDIGRVP